MNYIYLIEKNCYGAWVIYGAAGTRQFYYYSKKQAIQEYNNFCKKVIKFN